LYVVQELTYQYKQDEAWKTWPTRQPLVDFTLSSAKPLIIDMVEDFFSQLLPPLQRLQKKVSESVRAAQIEFEALKDTLEVYNRTTVLGPDFVRYLIWCYIRVSVYLCVCSLYRPSG